MDQKYLTDSESLSLNKEATCLLHLSPRNFPYEIKMDKYRPYPSMISMFTSDSQHPPRSRHAVHLGDGRGLMLWLFVRPNGVYLLDFFCFGIQFYLLLSPYLCFISFLYLVLYVLGDDALITGWVVTWFLLGYTVRVFEYTVWTF